ncbi:hypothetical protein AWZ03_002238 [Drosophila navojoa]|uniref:Secreted protein n=1 Tax=Drosophila navojoa TaxID=7232 RepID=A0A484BRS6_DRONA|nr:hypothetical protein AWZ03_002238 [Drosophila navojoa]
MRFKLFGYCLRAVFVSAVQQQQQQPQQQEQELEQQLLVEGQSVLIPSTLVSKGRLPPATRLFEVPQIT